MALLTMRQAAVHVGLTRQTLTRHISIGKVSATKDIRGNYQFDTAELLRAYGALQAAIAARPVTQPATSSAIDTSESAGVRAKLEIAEAKLEMERERVLELKAERDRLLALVEQQSRILAMAPAKRRGFLDFFTG